jgi:hypothetical protein
MTYCGGGGAHTTGGGAQATPQVGPQIVVGTTGISQVLQPPPNGIHWAEAVWDMPPRLNAPNMASLLNVQRDMEPFLSKVGEMGDFEEGMMQRRPG